VCLYFVTGRHRGFERLLQDVVTEPDARLGVPAVNGTGVAPETCRRQLNHVLENNGGCNKYLVRRDESGLLLVVHVEDDDDHYDEGTATRAAAIAAKKSNGVTGALQR
jgi:hypothetical protein